MIPRQAIAIVSIEVDFINLFDRFSAAQASVSAGHRYSTQLISASNSVIIGSGSTRGLAVHPFGMSSLFSETIQDTDAFHTHCQPRGRLLSPSYSPFRHISR